MHILLTGTAGNVGKYMLPWLVKRDHTVTALDIVPVPEAVLARIPTKSQHLVHHKVFDLTDYKALDELFEDARTAGDPITGVIHLAGVPKPMTYDQRYVHNNNVTCSYNIMRTAADHGVKRIVQASSMNAMGMSFTPEGHAHWDHLPFDEESPKRPVSLRWYCSVAPAVANGYNRKTRTRWANCKKSILYQ
jgi:nucleoside-diphosphate-sugar epimerase